MRLSAIRVGLEMMSVRLCDQTVACLRGGTKKTAGRIALARRPGIYDPLVPNREDSKMVADDVVEALRRSVARPASDPFKTYQEFAREHGLSESFPLSWANRNALNKAADALKADPDIGIDLTFLIRNRGTGYPSVIDAKKFDASPAHRQRARDVANQKIAKFGLTAQNPY
jgi:hypothetical protein